MCGNLKVNGKSVRIDSIKWLNIETMTFQKLILTLNKKPMLVIFGTKRVGKHTSPPQPW